MNDLVKESSDNKFVPDVMEASRDALILVDFWAPWCAPCRQLGPALEKVIGEFGGSVRLVKINIDENPAIAGQLGVKSIPAVFAFKDAKPVDAFMGAVPEVEIRKFIEKNGAGAGDPHEQDREAASTALENGDAETASALYSAILRESPEDMEAIAGLARAAMALGNLEAAGKALELVPADKLNDPEILSLKAEVELAGQSGGEDDIEALHSAVENNPQDHEARIKLATALNNAGQREEAVDVLIASIAIDATWNDAAARHQLLKFFDAWGPADPLSNAGRRKLSSILFS